MSQIKETIEKVERLEEQRRTFSDDIKQVYSEAKSAGLDTRVLRKIVADRKRNPQDVKNFEAVYDAYVAQISE
jgi:uncharacterized protein (UPF0335 family)